jgi:hypothetical protein
MVAGHNGDLLFVPRPQACRLIGVSDRTFSRLEAEGVITAATPRHGRRASTFDAAAVVASYIAYRERKLTESQENPRDRRDRAVAEWTELRIARERRVLLPRDQVVEEGRRYVGAVQSRLRAIVPRLRQETGLDATIAAKVDTLVEEAIEEMAGWRTALELVAAEDVA